MGAAIGNKQDGKYALKEVLDYLNRDFKCEKDLCDYIELNMDLFCTDLLGSGLKSYEREHRIFKRKFGGVKSQRLDFYIKTVDNQYIVLECKNPFYAYDNTNAIGQILSYRSLMRMADKKADRFVLVTTKLDLNTIMVLQDNDLNIELIGFDRSKSLSWNGQNGQ